MEKRIFLAIVVSIAVLFLWSAIAPKLFPDLVRKPEPPKPAATATTTAGSAAAATATTTTAPSATTPGATAAAVPSTPVSAARQQYTVVDHPDYTAVFSNRGAQLVSFRLKDYDQKRSSEPVELVKGRAPQQTTYPFSVDVREKAIRDELNAALYAVTDRTDRGVRTIEYRYVSPRGLSATKTFRFSDRPYIFDFAMQLAPATPYRVMIGPGLNNYGPEAQDSQVLMTGNVVVQQDGDFEMIPREKAAAFQILGNVDYVGLEDNYFLTALRPARGAEAVLRRISVHNPATKSARIDVSAGVNATADGAVSGEAYFGPKETRILDAYGFGEALQLGFFGPIARLFLTALLWINNFTVNYGWAIVVLTIIIKIALYPLQHKSIVSMKKMQKVQPKMEAIKAKYKKAKTDPEQRQKMNVEVMQLYQKEGINPMAGCLPILLQLPILWGFYGLLSRAIELRGAPFMLWVQDLSEKDPTYVLPILMTATMFIQTYITPSTGDPTQRRIFLIMPLVFGFFFKDFPSGLVLYWLVQNVLTIIQQMIMNKWWKDHPEEIKAA